MVLGQAVLSLGLIVSVIFFRSRLQANDQKKEAESKQTNKSKKQKSKWHIFPSFEF